MKWKLQQLSGTCLIRALCDMDTFSMQYRTFDNYVSALSLEAPHALVQDWWSRLEHEIRAVSRSLGYEYRNSAAEMIAALGMHPSIDTDIIEELHKMRHTRNAVAHDLDAPAPSADEAQNYARRALALSWYLSELR